MMFPYKIDANLELRILGDEHAELMFYLIQHNRAHLDRWLRWSARVQTLDDTRVLIQRFHKKFDDHDGFHAGIWSGGVLAGGIVCHFINRESNKAEIGYWLGADFTDKG